MAAKLSNGNYRGRVRDPRTGKQIAPHTVIGGPRTYRTLAEREGLREEFLESFPGLTIATDGLVLEL